MLWAQPSRQGSLTLRLDGEMWALEPTASVSHPRGKRRGGASGLGEWIAQKALGVFWGHAL